jgi:NADPH:quinone reductase-like Zn-dependent oxidoreductase
VKAVRYDHTGGPEVLEYLDVADPVPDPLDVLIRVEACALNRLDLVQRDGWYQMPGFQYPHIPGMDVAGTVVEVGSRVTNVKVGDRVVVDPSLSGVPEGSKFTGKGDLFGVLAVIGATEDGGYAELCLAPCTHVYPVPDGMAIEHAAEFPTCWLTAGHGLFDVGKLQAGETVLMHAAGSGVSVAGIQLAKRAGAEVFATAGTDAKCERALALGADHVLNNRTGDIVSWVRSLTGGKGVNMVYEHVGTALFPPSVFATGVHGRIVVAGNSSGDTATIPSLGYVFHCGISIIGADPYRPEEFGPLWRQYCEGDFPSIIDSEFPLADAAAAQEKLARNEAFGKIILRP